MSTNTSQNLGLHLWEPTDQVLRTEFNQNWQKIDTAVGAALTPDGVPCQYGTFSVNANTAAGTNLVTFSFNPRVAILEFHLSHYIIPQNGSQTIIFTNDSYSITVQLKNNTLRLTKAETRLPASYSGKFVVWP